jgi:glycosyltransferase involved in cell wall biosynthesis
VTKTPWGVLHVVAAGEIGGAERMLLDLLGAENPRPRAVALFTPNDRLRALFVDAGVDVVDRGPVREGPVPFLKSSLGRADVRWLADVIARRGARIVHLHTFASQVLGTRAARAAGARIVRTEHSTRVYDDPSCWPFSRWSLRHADAVVCISKHVRDVALARATFLPSSRVSVVYNGVDVDRFGGVPPRAPGERVRFVAVGRLDPRKGLDLALEALAMVPRAELEIVGDGEERSALERLARRLHLDDRVRFAGWMTDARPAVERADAALSSARAEGLGIALLEAMAMARPVVGVPVGGIVEIVRDGESGWLAGARTAAALARAMQAAIDAPEERARRGQRAREEVVKRFSLDAMRRGYERVYAELEHA